MTRPTLALIRAIFSVWLGNAQRIAAPGRFKVWRDECGFHVSVRR